MMFTYWSGRITTPTNCCKSYKAIGMPTRGKLSSKFIFILYFNELKVN